MRKRGPENQVISLHTTFEQYDIACIDFFTGWIYDVTKNYDIPFFAFGTMMVFGGALIFLAYLMDRKKRRNSDRNEIQ